MTMAGRGRSLRVRLIGVGVLVATLVLALALLSDLRLIQRTLDAQLEARVRAVELAYRTAVIVPLAARDYATLRDILQGWHAAEDIEYLVVTDPDGRVLASSGWDENLIPPTAGRTGTTLHARFTVDYLGQHYGDVGFGLSLAFIDQARRALLMHGVMIAAVGVVLTLILFTVVSHYLIRPLVRLGHAADKVGRGEFDVHVSPAGVRELDRLAHGFNMMTGAIRAKIADLSESEQRFRAIADHTYAWESWFDPDGQLRWVNPAVERITGYRPEECLVQADFPLALAHPDDRRKLHAQRAAALSGEAGENLEFRVRRRDGELIWVAMSWQPIHDDEGQSLGYRSSIRDITAQRHASAELAWQARHDPLTGLHNRRAFEQHLRERLAASPAGLYMLYIDLDQFKAINDSCGHTAGDELLVDLTRQLAERAGRAFIARLGGDEFGLILDQASQADALALASAIIDDVRSIPFYWEGRSFRLGASIGVAGGAGIGSIKDLMIAADTACFAAKERGRNRAEVYSPEDDYFRQRAEEFHSVAQIHSALAEGRFVLYHQRLKAIRPDLRDHAEILLRVRDASGEIHGPASFIRAAERYNLMSWIDRWVVTATCEQLGRWLREGFECGIDRFAINVSGASLSDPNFPGHVREQLKVNGIAASQLCFEITESCAVSDLDAALSFIEEVRGLGAAVALDDFGSGLSSFAYLKRFNVDYLKIDGMFIQNLDSDESNRAVVQAIVTLAKAHRLTTVAEFVSSPELLEASRQLDVDYAQGFNCHVPEPLSALRESFSTRA